VPEAAGHHKKRVACGGGCPKGSAAPTAAATAPEASCNLHTKARHGNKVVNVCAASGATVVGDVAPAGMVAAPLASPWQGTMVEKGIS